MSSDPILQIEGLEVAVEDTPILRGVDLTVPQGEVHALMGPNGSGKSTLAYALAGHPRYEITGGTARFDGQDIAEMEADERARLGLFLAMQYPVEVPGVSVMNFLRTSMQAIRGEEISPRDFVKLFDAKSKLLGFDRAFADRYLNEGFSGGEKKRHEILQMAMLEPRFAVLDETDSGLDIDALKVVSNGVNAMRGPGLGVLLITHYTRILRYIQPDVVHVMFEGHRPHRGPELAGTSSTATWSSGRPRRPPLPPGDGHRRRDRRDGPAGRLPDPVPDGARRAARLPRLGGHVAEADGRARRDGGLLPRDQRQRPPRRLRAGPSARRFEAGRDAVARLVGAPREGLVFAKNASEAINLVAWAWGVRELKPGDEVLITEMEHHSNIVPWQIVAEITGATVRFVPVTPGGELDMDSLRPSGKRHGWSAWFTPAMSSGPSTPLLRSPRWRTTMARSAWWTARRASPHAGRRVVDRLRLLRLHRPQDAQADRHRLPGRQARDPRRHGALPGRRRDDLERHDRGQHLGRPALEVRGRDPRSPRRWGSAPPRST